MVAYPPTECSETPIAFTLAKNSGADVRTTEAMVGHNILPLDIEPSVKGLPC